MINEFDLEFLKVLQEISKDLKIVKVFLESNFEKYKRFRDTLIDLKLRYKINDEETIEIDNLNNIQTYIMVKNKLMMNYGFTDEDIENFERIEKVLNTII